MPTKHTRDSVDQILEELSNEQTERGVRNSVTDRQVDAILQSIGMDPHGTSAGQDNITLGPIQAEDLPDVKLNAGDVPTTDRFSTTILDDLLGDLPSLRAAKANKPAPRPAPKKVEEVTPKTVKTEEKIQNVQKAPPRTPKPAPAPAPQPPAAEKPDAVPPMETGADAGDTTRTSIIKGFLKKMAPDGGADTDALNLGKEQFQNFFEKSAAVVPDENGRLRDPSKKKKGLFGMSSAADTGEFTPINFTLRGDSSEETPGEEPAREDAVREKRPGFFQRMFGGRPQEQEPSAPAEWEESSAPDPEPAPEPAPKADNPFEDLPQEDPDQGQSLEFSLPTATQAGISLTGDTLSMTPPAPSAAPAKTAPAPKPEQPPRPAAPAPAQPQPVEQTSTIYRKKRDTVEFTPRKRKEKRFPRPEPPRTKAEPVGEPVMTSTEQVAPKPAPRPAPQPNPAPAVSGFTQQFGGAQPAEDTQDFLAALGTAAPRSTPVQTAPARTAPDAQDSRSGDTFEELPREVAQTLTGQVRLTEIAEGVEASAPNPPAPAPAREKEPDVDVFLGPQVEEKPDTAEFVRGIEQSINLEQESPAQAPAGDETGRYDKAARILTNPDSDEVPTAPQRPAKPRRTRVTGVPEDEVSPEGEPPFVEPASGSGRCHEYESADDAPAVRKELENRVLLQTVTTIVSAAAAVVLLYLGTAAASGALPMPAALDPAAGTAPLMVTMLILLGAVCGLCWKTLLHGVVGLFNLKKGATADTMPALAAVAALAQCVAFLAKPGWYDPARLCLMAGPAALLLCGNALGKVLDARTVRDNFALVSAGVDHAVAYRLRDAGVLHTVTSGLAEPRPNVLVSRPTRLLKGFLAGSAAKGTSDKNQQQFARIVSVAALVAFVFTLLYRKNTGMAFSVLAEVLCLAAPLAGTLISALPMRLMQRSAAQIGAVIPGWKDIRQLGRINVLQVTARDLFPKGCVTLCGIKPVRKEGIDLAIIYSASMLAGADTPLKDVFLGMTGENRKLLCKVDDFETVYGLGYVGWINGERVLIGSRRLMDRYDVKLPPVDYERRHTVNQRRVIYLAVSGKLFSMFQVAYQSDPDTAAVLETLRRAGLSLIVDCDDFNCDEALLQAAYNLPAGTVKVLSGRERAALEPAVAWLPESEGNMLHLGSFASFVGGLEAAAGAAEGEHKASAVLSCSVLISCVLALVMALAGGLTSLPLPAVALYQVAWAVLAMIFPMIQRY